MPAERAQAGAVAARRTRRPGEPEAAAAWARPVAGVTAGRRSPARCGRWEPSRPRPARHRAGSARPPVPAGRAGTEREPQALPQPPIHAGRRHRLGDACGFAPGALLDRGRAAALGTTPGSPCRTARRRRPVASTGGRSGSESVRAMTSTYRGSVHERADCVPAVTRARIAARAWLRRIVGRRLRRQRRWHAR
jgi:hypothetical protein